MVSGYAEKFKMMELSDYSSSSEGDEYSDPLEVAAGAGARLSTPEKASISPKRKVQTNPAEKKRNVRGSVDPNVSVWDRVNEFDGSTRLGEALAILVHFIDKDWNIQQRLLKLEIQAKSLLKG